MTQVPGTPDTPGGTRQQRAAQLRAEMEARGAATEQAGAAEYHRVQEGETLESIAAQYNQSPSAIWDDPHNDELRQRRTAPDALEPGDELYIPGQETEPDTGPVGQGEHVVRRGECITSLAKNSGHLWETIWNDAGNTELREVRQDPNVLLPEDRVTIPAIRKKQEPGETEMRHRFVRRGEPAYLRLRVLDDDRPLSNQPYELTVDQQSFTGTTDPQGQLDVPIPGNANRATLVVGVEPDTFRYVLDLGEIEPVESVRGVQQRLRNLGFGQATVDGVVGPKTEEALRAFQKVNELPETGRPDTQTRQKLKENHGS